MFGLCDLTLDPGDQEILSDLLAGQREGALTDLETATFDRLMDAYRRGILLKARAFREAVSRGLRPPLSEDAA